VAAQVIRKGLDHLTVSLGVIFTLLLLLAAKNKGKGKYFRISCYFI